MLDADGIPAGADPVWQPPFWLQAMGGLPVPAGVLAVMWHQWFAARAGEKLYAALKDAMLHGTSVMRVGWS